ncbi:hypothetical protein SUGI_0010290 [Cryptomeria japonica]|nr:hypothetical protein SUGI_0010290 [Cryptomeria japonica]
MNVKFGMVTEALPPCELGGSKYTSQLDLQLVQCSRAGSLTSSKDALSTATMLPPPASCIRPSKIVGADHGCAFVPQL